MANTLDARQKFAQSWTSPFPPFRVSIQITSLCPRSIDRVTLKCTDSCVDYSLFASLTPGATASQEGWSVDSLDGLTFSLDSTNEMHWQELVLEERVKVFTPLTCSLWLEFHWWRSNPRPQLQKCNPIRGSRPH